MSLDRYRQVLALPGVKSLLLVSLLIRVPFTAAGITLTLYVVLALDRGYAAAGLVGTAATVGAAIGAPVLGRMIDRRGLRLVLAVTATAEVVFWSAASFLPYPVLLAAAFGNGLVTLPAFAVIRQSVAALVPEPRRRPAYALDSMAVEVAFMAGPALAVLAATMISPQAALLAVGGGMVLGGITLFALNPPIREVVPTTDSAEPAATVTAPPRRREWLRARLVAMLLVTAATTFVLIGTDLSIVAAMREIGKVEWTGAVLVLWAAYSLAGGFCYGILPRALPPYVLLGLLGLFTIPVGLATGGPWWWLAIAMVAAGALVAPTLAATTDAVSRLVPASVRGEAMGWHNSAMTIGLAVGAPVTGAVIDRSAAGWGFATVGVVGLLAATATGYLRSRQPVPSERLAGSGEPTGIS